MSQHLPSGVDGGFAHRPPGDAPAVTRIAEAIGDLRHGADPDLRHVEHVVDLDADPFGQRRRRRARIVGEFDVLHERVDGWRRWPPGRGGAVSDARDLRVDLPG